MTATFWRLDGHTPVRTDAPGCAAAIGDVAQRTVGRDKVGDTLVSTVFLGVDHSFGEGGPPILFETMVFGGRWDAGGHLCERYATWDAAAAGHARWLRHAQEEDHGE